MSIVLSFAVAFIHTQDFDTRSRAIDIYASPTPFITITPNPICQACTPVIMKSCPSEKFANGYITATCDVYSFTEGCMELCGKSGDTRSCSTCGSASCHQVCSPKGFPPCTEFYVWGNCSPVSTTPFCGSKWAGGVYCCNNDDCRLNYGNGWICDTFHHSCVVAPPATSAPTVTPAPYPNRLDKSTWDPYCVQHPSICGIEPRNRFCKFFTCDTGTGKIIRCRGRNISQEVVCATQL